MQGLYQLEVQGSDVLDFPGGSFAETDADENIAKQTVAWTKGAWENVARCDELIIASTIKWQFPDAHSSQKATKEKDTKL